MKISHKKGYYLSLAALILVSFVMASCKEPAETMSVSERMDAFKADVNKGNYIGLKAHTHPDAAMYAGAGVPTYWSNEFVDTDFTVESVNGETATAKCASTSYTFYLKEDGTDMYKIYKINKGVVPFFY